MTMHRLMGSFDCLPLVSEVHTTAIGASNGSPINLLINPGGVLGFWKVNWSIHMGAIHTRALAQGHDAGPWRRHVLVVSSDPALPDAASR